VSEDVDSKTQSSTLGSRLLNMFVGIEDWIAALKENQEFQSFVILSLL